MTISPTPTEAEKVVAEIDREAEKIAESVMRRAPIFLERITTDLYDVLPPLTFRGIAAAGHAALAAAQEPNANG